MTPRGATSVCIFVNGALVGTWVAQIPFVQERFEMESRGRRGSRSRPAR